MVWFWRFCLSALRQYCLGGEVALRQYSAGVGCGSCPGFTGFYRFLPGSRLSGRCLAPFQPRWVRPRGQSAIIPLRQKVLALRVSATLDWLERAPRSMRVLCALAEFRDFYPGEAVRSPVWLGSVARRGYGCAGCLT